MRSTITKKEERQEAIALKPFSLYFRKMSLSYAQRESTEENHMAIRKATLRKAPPRPELDRLLEEARKTGVTEDQLREQRASFAYGNAPENSRITKESARTAANSLRLARA